MKLAKDVQVEQLAARRELQELGVTKTMLERLSAKQINRLWCVAYGQQRFGRPRKNRNLARFADQIKAGKITKWRTCQSRSAGMAMQLLLAFKPV